MLKDEGFAGPQRAAGLRDDLVPSEDLAESGARSSRELCKLGEADLGVLKGLHGQGGGREGQVMQEMWEVEDIEQRGRRWSGEDIR